MYTIELEGGRQVRRLVDHMRHYTLAREAYTRVTRGVIHQPPSPQTEVQPDQTQHSIQKEAYPAIKSCTKESRCLDVEHSKFDTETVTYPVQAEPLSSTASDVVPELSDPDHSMSGRRVSNRQTKTPSSFIMIVLYTDKFF